MASRFVKLPALQGATQVIDGTSLDFVIPAGMTIDPARSYISLIATVVTTDTNPPAGVHQVYATYNGGNPPFRNSALLSDYELRSATMGTLESILSSNIINVNLDAFSRDWEQLQSDSYRSLTQFCDPSGWRLAGAGMDPLDRTDVLAAPAVGSPFFTRDGAQAAELKIYLPELSPACRQLPLIDTRSWGETRLRVKVDTDAVTVREMLPYPQGLGSGLTNCDNVGAAGNAVITVETSITAADFDIAVGRNVLVQYTVTGSGLVTGDMRDVANLANVGAGVVTVTLGGAAIPISTAVSIWLINPTVLVQATTQPLGNMTYIDIPGIAPFGTDLDYYEGLYVGSTVGVVYPDAGGRRVRTATVASVTNTAGPASPIRLTFTAAVVNPVGTGPGNLYVMSQPRKACTGAADLTVLTFPATTPDALRLIVGQKLRTTCDDNANPPANRTEAFNLITAIAYNGTDTTVTLGTDRADGDVARVRVQTLPMVSGALVLGNPTIVLKQVVPDRLSSPSGLTFTTYAVEICAVPNGTVEFNRQFDCPPGTSAIYFLVVDRAADMLSFAGQMAWYRMRLNDMPVTTENVVPMGPLHMDGVIQALGRSEVATLRCLATYVKPQDTGLEAQEYGKDAVFVMCCVIPDGHATGRLNRVQLAMRWDGGTGTEYTLYAVREQMRR